MTFSEASAPPLLFAIVDLMIACTRCSSWRCAAARPGGYALSAIVSADGVKPFVGAGAYARIMQPGLAQSCMPSTGYAGGCGMFLTHERLSRVLLSHSETLAPYSMLFSGLHLHKVTIESTFENVCLLTALMMTHIRNMKKTHDSRRSAVLTQFRRRISMFLYRSARIWRCKLPTERWPPAAAVYASCSPTFPFCASSSPGDHAWEGNPSAPVGSTDICTPCSIGMAAATFARSRIKLGPEPSICR